MKKALVIVLTILVLAAIGGIGYLSTLDGKYTVSRSIDINTTTEQVASVVADFNTWPTWSPWLCMEPAANVKITGKGNLPGSILSWHGDMIGAGELELLAIDSTQSITQEIRFSEPFQSTSTVTFSFTPQKGGVTVTWDMNGEMPFFFRFLTESMVPLIESDYDRGLKMLKELVEKGSVSSKIKIKGQSHFDGLTYLGKSDICDMEMVGEKMQQTFYEVGNWLVASSTFPEEGISIYKQFDQQSGICDYTSGFVIVDKTKTFPYAGAKLDSIASGKFVKVVFEGDYQHLPNAWTAAHMYLRHNNLKSDPNRNPFELYLNDPAFFPNPADWVTEVYIPIL
jgi:effector-binding domain-containing protein